MTDPEEMDPDPWEQLSRQEKEEDKRIIAMATERFDKAFEINRRVYEHESS